MRYAQIDKCECCNGQDIGVSLFTQGCPLHCPGCHNSSIWDFDGGEEWNDAAKDELLSLAAKPFVHRLSVLGGEPLIPANLADIAELLRETKEMKPTIKTWLYTGYLYEKLAAAYRDNGDFGRILSNLDILVDGPYLEAQRDITLKFKGSANQRLIDVPATLESGKVILATI